MEDTTRLNAGSREEAKQQVGAMATTARVPHFRPAALPAVGVAGAQPPHEPSRAPIAVPRGRHHAADDSGERLFVKYAFEQAARRRAHCGTIEPTAVVAASGRPCFECTDARRVSGGSSSSSGGGGGE